MELQWKTSKYHSRWNKVITSKTTDADGETTYVAEFGDAGNYDVVVSEPTSGVSTTVQIEVVDVDRIDLSASDEIVAKDNDILITATVYSDNVPVPGIAIHIDSQDYVTNSEGKAVHSYTGEGAGLTALYAGCGNCVEYITLNDVLMYFSQANQKNFNLDYTSKYSMSVLRKFNGLQLSSNPQDEGMFLFNLANATNRKWKLDFDVVSVTKNTDIQVSGYAINYSALKNKPHITVNCTSGDTKLVTTRVDDKTTVVGTSTNKNNFKPYIGVVGSIIIDNIILYEVE